MTEPMVVDIREPGLWQDPYPVWRAARQQHRTAVTPAGEPILLLADDVDAASSNSALGQLGVEALRRLGVTDGPFYTWRGLTLAACDGEQHERLRAVVGRSFTPRRVGVLRQTIRAHADRLLDEAMQRNQFDVVEDFAAPFPLWVICRFLGLEEEIDEEIATFIVGTEEGFAEPLTAERRGRAESGIVALYEVVTRLIDARRRAPGEDIISDLISAQDAGRLSLDELCALVVNVLGGAIGSSRSGISNGALLFLQHPDQAQELRHDPSLTRAAVEECLRFHPPFRSGRRRASQPVHEFGLELDPGDTVYISRQSANRDPLRWDDPDRFDIRREERRHLSFGYGAHFCLGQALARLDLAEALAAFVARLDRFQLVDTEPVRIPCIPDEAIEKLRVAVASPPGG